METNEKTNEMKGVNGRPLSDEKIAVSLNLNPVIIRDERHSPFTEMDAKMGKEPIYRDGKKPLEWHLFEKATSSIKFASVNEFGMVVNHTKDGKVHHSASSENLYDLIVESAKTEYWVNIYWLGRTKELCISRIYRSKEEAEETIEYGEFSVGTIKIAEVWT